MTKQLVALVFISLVIVSCYKYKEPEKPKNLISKGEMANILIDLRLIRSANGNNKKVLDSHYVEPTSYIYKKYNIDSLQFALSNDYYAYFVEDYEEIYIKIKDSLSTLKEKFKKETEEINRAKKVADSIKRAEKKAKQEKEKLEQQKLEEEKETELIKPVSDN